MAVTIQVDDIRREGARETEEPLPGGVDVAPWILHPLEAAGLLDHVEPPPGRVLALIAGERLAP